MKSLLLATVLFATIGCGLTPSAAQPGQGTDRAECIVCKHNADLACVDISVTKDTPKVLYEGTQYYFCSEECRANFLKNSSEYLDSANH